MKKITIILSAILGIIFLAACEKKETSNPIKIAAIEPLSGPYAAVGKDIIDIVTYSASVINKNGGNSFVSTKNHNTGTDRVFEAFEKFFSSEPSIIINLQA